MYPTKNLFLFLLCLFVSPHLKAQDLEENLLDAVAENNTTKMQELVGKGANVNFKDENNASIMLWAVYKMDLASIKFLVNKGGKIEEKDGYLWTDKQRDNYYGSLIAAAAGENKLDVLKYLVEEQKISIDSKEFSPQDAKYNGWTALQWAAYKGHLTIVTYLVKNKASINSFAGSNPLFYAITNKKEAVALYLIQNGADLTQKSQHGYSSLYLAVYYDLPEVVKAILGKKNYTISDNNLLQVALEKGNLGIFEFLVKKKVKVDAPFTDETYALHQAAKNGYLEIVNLLLSKKFPVNQTDKWGNTALMYAAYNNQTKICKILVQKGADKNIKNSQGQTALDFAQSRKLTESIDFLEKGIYKEPDTWQSLNQEAVRYFNQNRIEQASEAMEKACHYVAQKSGEGSEDYATALHNFARLKSSSQNYQLAETLFLKSLSIREKNNSPLISASLSDLAQNYYNKGNYQKALEYYTKLLQKQQNNTIPYAHTLNLIGNIQYLNTSFKESEAIFRKSLAIFKNLTGENSFDYAITLSNLGNLLQDMARYNEAINIYKQSLAIMESQHKNPAYRTETHMTIISNYADVLAATGEYNLAEYLYKNRVLEVDLGAGRVYSNKANVLNNLGVLYLQTHRLEGAELYLKESLNLKLKSLGENHPKYLSTLSYLGNLYLQKKEFSKAEKIYKTILKETQKNLSEKNVLYTNTLNSLAVLYNETDKATEAEKTYLKILEISKSDKDIRKSDYAYYLSNTGNFYNNQKKYLQAEQYIKEALAIRKEVLGDKHLSYHHSVYSLAQLYFYTGNLKEAHKSFKESNELALYLIKKNLPFMSDKGRTEFVEEFQQQYAVFAEFAIAYSKQDISILGDLYNLRLATKALLLNNDTEFYKKAQNSKDSIIVNYYNSYLKEKDILQKINMGTDVDSQHTGISLTSQIRLVENMEAYLHLILNNKKDTLSPKIQWTDLQKKLQPNEAAVEVIRLATIGEDRKLQISYLFLILKSKGYPEIVQIKNAEELENDGLKYFLNAIKYRKEDKASYKLYWSPVAEHLKGIKTVYLAPDHVYTQISLNTLKNTTTGKYLNDEVDLILLNNIKEILSPKVTAKKEAEAVFFGYPTYQLGKQEYTQTLSKVRGISTKEAEIDNQYMAQANNTREFSTLTLTTLPGTKEEVETIEEMLKKRGIKTKKFIGNEALEESIKEVKNPKVLHIATHGFFLSDISSKNEFDKILGIKKSVLAKNVLMRSGLMLAGAESYLKEDTLNTSIENGILTAQEAMNLNLSETELVVLSACETGLGEVKTGEGVYGLQRAFKIAGTKAILMSLWKVDDEATKELMINFYDNWVKTNDKRKSFKMAQAKLKAKFPHPYYWGAFILIGE